MNLLGHNRRQGCAAGWLHQRHLQTSETCLRINHHGTHGNGLPLMVLKIAIYCTEVRLHAARRDGI